MVEPPSTSSAPQKSKSPAASSKDRPGSPPSKNPSKAANHQDDKAARKELSQLEKSIVRLDAQKKTLNEQLMQSTEAIEALKLHEELTKVSMELEAAEFRWAELQELLGD